MPRDPKIQGPRVPRPPAPSGPTSLEKTEAPAGRVELDLSQIPEHVSVRDKASPLAGVIAQGLAKLADAQGWNQAGDSTLNVLVKAMGAGATSSSDADAEHAAGRLKSEFGALLRGHVKITPETLKQIRADAQQLVELGVVALGPDQLAGRGQAQQLVADLKAFKDALADVLARPEPERSASIEQRVRDLSWVANVLDRGKPALAAADLKPAARYDALVNIFRIVGAYARSSAAG